MIKRWITVNFQKEGIHSYPQALSDPNLAEVSYLGRPHRHMFHFKATIEVFHNDRDIEFIMFKHELESLYSPEGKLDCCNRSCEALAEELIDYIVDQYPTRDVIVEVSEDGENGSTLEFSI